MSIAVTTRIGRDHSAAIHHQNPNPRSAVRLSSFRVAFARAREAKRSEIRKGCDWKSGLFPSRNCIAAAAQSAGWHHARRSLLPAPLHLRTHHGAAASLCRLPDSSQQQMGHRCPRAQQLVASSCEPTRIAGSGYPCNSMRNPAVIIAAHYDSASTLRTRKTRDDFLTIGR